MEKTKMKNIPVGAFVQVATAIQAKESSDGNYSFTVQALGGEVIDHWWFGRIIQDISGMTMAQDRIPLDYNHNPDEIIGYAELQSTDDVLRLNATIVPFESDRGAEIVHKHNQGVPYQASIDYVPTKPDEILFEEIAEGQMTQVNGKEFEGPLTVVRKFVLHGLAICPHGADSDTSLNAQQSRNKKETMEVSVMENTKEEKEVQKTESTPIDSRSEFKQFVADFGVEKAGVYFEQGLSREAASKQYLADMKSELDAEKQARAVAESKLVEAETAKAKQSTQADGHFDGDGEATQKFTRQSIAKMSLKEYEQNRDEILDACNRGEVK